MCICTYKEEYNGIEKGKKLDSKRKKLKERQNDHKKVFINTQLLETQEHVCF